MSEPLYGRELAEEIIRREGRCPAFSILSMRTDCDLCPVRRLKNNNNCGGSGDASDRDLRIKACKVYLAATTPPTPTPSQIAVWKRIKAERNCNEFSCLECSRISSSIHCPFCRSNGEIPTSWNGGLDALANSKLDAAIQSATAGGVVVLDDEDTKGPSSVVDWRPESASRARVYERLYSRRNPV